jgi:ABC-type bacteriocin/lantibiotic exporter with double-glycine peptidase domain
VNDLNDIDFRSNRSIQLSKSQSKGELNIFGYDTSKINHKDHRSKIHHLNAHPTMFSGRFRENIDPQFAFTDKEIMSVMKYLDGVDVINQYFIGSNNMDLESKV